MTPEEFFNLLKDRLQKGESIDGYSYSSTNGTKVEIKIFFIKDLDIWLGIILLVIGICLLLIFNYGIYSKFLWFT